MFPVIPLGAGGANEIGGKNVFPGTHAVRTDTLRTIFMDLGTELGERGFRWIFVLHGHGAPKHMTALDQAAEYFNDTYGGSMVNLLGLRSYGACFEAGKDLLTAEQQREDGFTVHAGAEEHSQILYRVRISSRRPYETQRQSRQRAPPTWFVLVQARTGRATSARPAWPAPPGALEYLQHAATTWWIPV
jgi:creatinine amidohydrolase/Fe(II)-dependent formamide hydrolase-like protein